jgi:YegS/Rv2252/BmrU family lipid kinase
VVVGGDGSVNEVANGIAGRDDVEIAVIPRGTGWDFVRTYGIPHKLEGAIDVALTGKPRTIDLGRVRYRAWDGSEAETYFANVASAGMSGAIAQRANETTKALGGKISYLWATLAVFARWQNSELRLDVDGETRVGHMHDVVVANGRTFGGGMIICPEAEPDDGLFDVLTIGDLTRRCRSSSTASSPARRRRASRSCRDRCGSASPPRRRASSRSSGGGAMSSSSSAPTSTSSPAGR